MRFRRIPRIPAIEKWKVEANGWRLKKRRTARWIKETGEKYRLSECRWNMLSQRRRLYSAHVLKHCLAIANHHVPSFSRLVIAISQTTVPLLPERIERWRVRGLCRELEVRQRMTFLAWPLEENSTCSACSACVSSRLISSMLFVDVVAAPNELEKRGQSNQPKLDATQFTSPSPSRSPPPGSLLAFLSFSSLFIIFLLLLLLLLISLLLLQPHCYLPIPTRVTHLSPDARSSAPISNDSSELVASLSSAS